MKGIIKFARLEIKLILADKSFYLWALILPVVFIFVFSGMGFGGDGQQRAKPGLLITNHDAGDLSREFVEFIKKEDLYFYKESAENIRRELIIPKEFSSNLAKGDKVILQYKVNNDTLDTAGFSAKISLYRAIFKFIIKRFSGITKPKKFLDLKTSWQGNSQQVPSGPIHQIPATIVNFLLFNLLIYGGITIVRLRDRGILKRFATTPMGKFGIWGAVFITNIFVGIIVITMVFLTSAIIFSVSFAQTSLLGVFLVLIIYGASLSALSIFIGSVFKKIESVIGISVLLANILAALGGCWWPIEIVPDFMRKISLFLPSGWAVNATDKLLFFKYPLTAISTNLVFLFLFTVGFSLLSIKFFKISD